MRDGAGRGATVRSAPPGGSATRSGPTGATGLTGPTGPRGGPRTERLPRTVSVRLAGSTAGSVSSAARGPVASGPTGAGGASGRLPGASPAASGVTGPRPDGPSGGSRVDAGVERRDVLDIREHGARARSGRTRDRDGIPDASSNSHDTFPPRGHRSLSRDGVDWRWLLGGLTDREYNRRLRSRLISKDT
jgi:hypothetical protein